MRNFKTIGDPIVILFELKKRLMRGVVTDGYSKHLAQVKRIR